MEPSRDPLSDQVLQLAGYNNDCANHDHDLAMDDSPTSSDLGMSPPPPPEQPESPEPGPDAEENTSGGKTEAEAKASARTDDKKPKPSGTAADGKAKRGIKRRASQACVICRNRKVRCDCEMRHPCTNCIDSNTQCIIPESKRRRRNPSIYTHAILPTPMFTDPIPRNPSSPLSPTGQAPPYGWGLTDETRLSAAKYRAPSGTQFKITPQPYPIFGAPRAGLAQLPRGPSEQGDIWWTMVPKCFKPPAPGNIPNEGLLYLQAMGALRPQSPTLEKQLLIAYIEHVHPDFPVLELPDFLRRVTNRNSPQGGKVSLLLYQAVMFAASAFVKTEYLGEAGCSNRRALRRKIMSAAKLLHDLDYENDKFILLQSAFLLSFWYEAPDDAKETWHWSGIAISQAQALGLHRSTITAATSDPAKRRQQKKVWWSCVMRDRQISLGMSRLIRIKDEDFDVPMLDKTDFEIETEWKSDDCRLLYDREMQATLAEICVEKARLYVLIGRVLRTIQALQAAMTSLPTGPPPRPNIDRFLPELEAIHDDLRAWEAALPESCIYRSPTRADIARGYVPVVMQRSLLQLLYQTTIGKIYHPLIRFSFASSSSSTRPYAPLTVAGVAEQQQQESDMPAFALRTCLETASRTTSIAAELHALGLSSFFPTTGLTVIMPAMMMHLKGVSDADPARRSAAQGGFDECMSVLATLRGTYAAAEYAAIFMGNFIRKKPGLEGRQNHQVVNSKVSAASSTTTMSPRSSSKASPTTTVPLAASLHHGVDDFATGPPEHTTAADIREESVTGRREVMMMPPPPPLEGMKPTPTPTHALPMESLAGARHGVAGFARQPHQTLHPGLRELGMAGFSMSPIPEDSIELRSDSINNFSINDGGVNDASTNDDSVSNGSSGSNVSGGSNVSSDLPLLTTGGNSEYQSFDDDLLDDPPDVLFTTDDDFTCVSPTELDKGAAATTGGDGGHAAQDTCVVGGLGHDDGELGMHVDLMKEDLDINWNAWVNLPPEGSAEWAHLMGMPGMADLDEMGPETTSSSPKLG